MKRIATMALLLGLALAVSGCALGITTSDRLQGGAQVCVLSAEPIIFGQARPKARAWGFAFGHLLLGAPLDSAYVRSTGIS